MADLINIKQWRAPRSFKGWVKFPRLALDKHIFSLSGVSVAASVLTLMFMSLERFVAIRYPVQLRKLCSKKRIKVGIFVIWLASTAIMSPLVTVRRLQEGLLPDDSIAFCNEVWSSKAAIWTFDICLLLFIYLTPGGVIVVAYSLIGCKLITTTRQSTLHRMDSEVRVRLTTGLLRHRIESQLITTIHLGRNSGPKYHQIHVGVYVRACMHRKILVAWPGSWPLRRGHINNNCGKLLHDDLACPNMASATRLHTWTINWLLVTWSNQNAPICRAI
jgi:hypothetical protein